jgi:hypothetical protein
VKRGCHAGALTACAVGLSLLAALLPSLHRQWVGAQVAGRLRALNHRAGMASSSWPRSPTDGVLALGAAPVQPGLASWTTVGGCGAGGGSASAPGGGIKWIGRNVTGGRLDTQVLSTQTFAEGDLYTSISARLAVSPRQRLTLALNVPVVFKAGDVSVLGQTKQAQLSGFGDLGLEASYRLGAIGSHQVLLTLMAPTGSADAVRQGVVLPQHLQLGAGVPGATLQYEHTRDQVWGLLIFGGAASYNGWENEIGDYRAPSATAYAHIGYLLDRWVPSAGLTVFGKTKHDRERGADRTAARDPLFMLIPSLGIEWSRDWIAVLPAATMGLSLGGFESVSVGVGVSSSLF